MFWNDEKLREWAKNNGIIPYEPELINPASIDLRIGEHCCMPIEPGWTDPIKIPKEGILLHSNQLYLLHTYEYTRIPTNAIALIYLKSTMGRRGIEHLHAGYGDPGFEGQWTLEVINHHPYPQLLKPNEPLIQLILCDVYPPALDYSKTGHYQNQRGPTLPWHY